ncbi:Chitinase domain-containing protein 1 [Hordeum vulgare]|nr:Chitinase domain-containing protein 1 [Hordeum vulgare]
MAFFHGCSLGDCAKFEDTMKVCSNFTSMEEVHNESDAVVKKATTKELKTLIPDPAKGAISVDVLRSTMNQANPEDARQRAKWVKYKEYNRPNDDHAAMYWTTRTMVDLAE